MEAGHRIEVGSQRLAASRLKLLNQALHVGGDYFFRRLPLLLLLLSSFHFFAPRLPGRTFLFLTSAVRQKRRNEQTGQNDDRDPA
jgi:hypothetical protein